MFTCGLGNVHGNRVVDGVEYPVHGRMRTTPSEKISMDAFWENGEYKIRVSGEMREAQIFGENLVLRRTVETVYGTREIVFTDEIENQGFEEQLLCFLYHCRVSVSGAGAAGRDAIDLLQPERCGRKGGRGGLECDGGAGGACAGAGIPA